MNYAAEDYLLGIPCTTGTEPLYQEIFLKFLSVLLYCHFEKKADFCTTFHATTAKSVLRVLCLILYDVPQGPQSLFQERATVGLLVRPIYSVGLLVRPIYWYDQYFLHSTKFGLVADRLEIVVKTGFCPTRHTPLCRTSSKLYKATSKLREFRIYNSTLIAFKRVFTIRYTAGNHTVPPHYVLCTRVCQMGFTCNVASCLARSQVLLLL